MKEYTIKTADEIFSIFKKYRKSTIWRFRGQSNVDWDLIPKAGRQPYGDYSDEKLFGFWKKRAVSFVDKDTFSDWELLAIAQHNGLPTRLLDWSFNSWIAAFFACTQDDKNDGAVFAFYPEAIVNEKTDKLFSNNFDKNILYSPRTVSNRISSQYGHFTYHPNPLESMTNKNTDGEIEKVIIPKKLKKEITHTLNQFGINYLTLFPDLEGLSKHLCWFTENNNYWDTKLIDEDIIS